MAQTAVFDGMEGTGLDFWIDQYGADLDAALNMAIKVSRGEVDEAVTKQFRDLDTDSHTTLGITRLFCEIVMTFDLISLGHHRGEGLAAKICTFFERLQHSNFTENDANILAAVVIKLSASNEKILHETKEVRDRYAKTNIRFNPKLVHPKIALIARNLHPEINDLYEKLA